VVFLEKPPRPVPSAKVGKPFDFAKAVAKWESTLDPTLISTQNKITQMSDTFKAPYKFQVKKFDLVQATEIQYCTIPHPDGYKLNSLANVKCPGDIKFAGQDFSFA
jgi:hypothetical protein